MMRISILKKKLGQDQLVLQTKDRMTERNRFCNLHHKPQSKLTLPIGADASSSIFRHTLTYMSPVVIFNCRTLKSQRQQ